MIDRPAICPHFNAVALALFCSAALRHGLGASVFETASGDDLLVNGAADQGYSHVMRASYPTTILFTTRALDFSLGIDVDPARSWAEDEDGFLLSEYPTDTNPLQQAWREYILLSRMVLVGGVQDGTLDLHLAAARKVASAKRWAWLDFSSTRPVLIWHS
jgi:hypothetical protein